MTRTRSTSLDAFLRRYARLLVRLTILAVLLGGLGLAAYETFGPRTSLSFPTSSRKDSLTPEAIDALLVRAGRKTQTELPGRNPFAGETLDGTGSP